MGLWQGVSGPPGAGGDAGKNGQLPAVPFWTDAHNHVIPMTADGVLAMEEGMMVVKGFEIHQRQRQMQQALDNLNTLEEIRVFRMA
ncbi:DUF4376 domain-containing protein [Salmonella enterica subsp. enterica]|nr:DUF4376 domain-containing protein [Salmonella enterica subsp. enterica]